MSVVPSLTLWSSIKIPFSFNSIKRKDAAIVKSREELQGGGESVRNMVNLKVPYDLGEEKENSTPPDVSTIIRKKSSRKPFKKIGFVTIPEENSQSETENSLQPQEKNNFMPECAVQDVEDPPADKPCEWSQDVPEDEHAQGNLSEENLSEEKSVPLVKRCTKEELEEINRRYRIMEERIKRISAENRKKRRRKGVILEKGKVPEPFITNDTSKKSFRQRNPKTDPVLQPKDFCIDTEVLHAEFDLDSDQEVTPESCTLEKASMTHQQVRLADKNYYESKLNQLYMIELGIKL